MIDHKCVPFQRKSLYLALTIPMIVMYIAVAVYLWSIHFALTLIYLAFFIGVAFCMAYVCVHWGCPYVGRFAPCVGGFCLPSSRIALLFKNVKRSEGRYQIFYNMAFFFFFAIIFFPAYFLYQQSLGILFAYIAIVLLYWAVYTLFVCPACATRYKCPGGKMAVAIQKKMGNEE